jgi:glutathione synthase/RimK-type ligase-like ATP-grasp enzyme
MKPVFFPYKLGSASAKKLALAFNAERVRPDGQFRNNFKRPIINWGNSQVPNWMNKWKDQVTLNHPDNVKIASNKLLTFKKFAEHGVKCPEWTTTYPEGLGGDHWFARKTLTGKGGDGIVSFVLGEDIVAPLYTKYFKKKYEFRIHVFGGKVIDFVLKKKQVDVEVNYQVRNHKGGWVFCREGVVVPVVVLQEAIKAVAALGLTFGAVDVGYNEKKNEPCVFEVNTAPGIEGTTLDRYVKAFKEILE